MSELREELAKVPQYEALATKWRSLGVPEDIITRALEQRASIMRTRAVEEWITVPNFPYKIPRLAEIEARSWGFAKIIDTEGTILVRSRIARDRVRKIDKWLYRYEYYQPIVVVKTRNYDLTEEIANIQHVRVIISKEWDVRMGKWALYYGCRSTGVRAIRLCLLIEPHLVVPQKKERARQILIIYKDRPTIPIKY